MDGQAQYLGKPIYPPDSGFFAAGIKQEVAVVGTVRGDLTPSKKAR